MHSCKTQQTASTISILLICTSPYKLGLLLWMLQLKISAKMNTHLTQYLSYCKLHKRQKPKDIISIRHKQNIMLRFHSKIEVWLAVDITYHTLPSYREKGSFNVNKNDINYNSYYNTNNIAYI